MGRKRKKRRQAHGSAWYWKQTGCWYYTMPGTKKWGPLFGKDGQRIRGEENKEAAELALAKEKLSWEKEAPAPARHCGQRSRQPDAAGIAEPSPRRREPLAVLLAKL